MKLSYNWASRYWTMKGVDSPEQFIERYNQAGYTLEKTTVYKAGENGVIKDNIVWDIDVPRSRDDLLCMMWNTKECCGLFHTYFLDNCAFGHWGPSHEWEKEVIPERHRLYLSLTLHSYTDKVTYLDGQVIGSVNPNGKVHDFINDEVIALEYPYDNIYEMIQLYCIRNCGVPYYFFDAEKISTKEISLKEADESGVIYYHGQPYEYDTNDVVMVSNNKVIGIGGIIIDDSVAPTKETTSLIIMCMSIDYKEVTRLIKKLKIDTFNGYVASFNTNPCSVSKGLGYATSYLYECCSAKEIYAPTVMNKYDQQRIHLRSSVSEINAILGSDYSYEEIKEILSNGQVQPFDLEEDGDHFKVKLQSYSLDKYSCDLAQRIINYDGYKRIGKGGNKNAI